MTKKRDSIIDCKTSIFKHDSIIDSKTRILLLTSKHTYSVVLVKLLLLTTKRDSIVNVIPETCAKITYSIVSGTRDVLREASSNL